MVESEERMVRKLPEVPETAKDTSLQPTYEDSVPGSDEDWELED